MKNAVLRLFAAFALVTAVFAQKAEEDWAGKTVMIKTSKEGATCIRIETFAPTVGKPDKANLDAAAFKIIAGAAPGTVAF
jgi:hypothetical protein